MLALVSDKRAEVVALCERYGVRRLELFGSAATGTFDPATSDLDFVVDLGEYGPDVAKRYLRFAEALEALFERPVDLLTVPSIRNQYFIDELEATRQVIYAP
ncbi:MAG: nucleotidyltransferase domain-containing protein [Thermomicrobiales bacterium]